MPRVCSICSSEHRDEIEDAFLAGMPKRRIAAQYDVTEQALRRHLGEHLPALLALARDAERASRGDTLLDRLEHLQQRTETILDELEGTDLYGARLGAIREMRRNLEIIGEVTRELDRRPTFNLNLNPQWAEFRVILVGALSPYPEARRALDEALERAEALSG